MGVMEYQETASKLLEKDMEVHLFVGLPLPNLGIYLAHLEVEVVEGYN